MKRLLLLGGGHSHVEVLRRFGLQARKDVRIILVSPDRYTPYSGMLPGFIAGHYAFHDCHIDLERVSGFAGAQFVQARATGIDSVRRSVLIADGSALQYDIASIDIGSVPPTAGIPGAAENTIAVKPVGNFLRAWDGLAGAGAHATQRIAVVGGGAAGVEILLSMQYRLAQPAAADMFHFLLVTDADCLLPGHAPAARAVFERVLRARNVDIHYRSRVSRVEPGVLVTASDRRIAADAIVWATGSGAPPLLRNTGLALDAAGFIAVNAQLQAIMHPDVFAAGDCATIQGSRYPKSGVYAVRQGPLLAENLQRALAGKSLRAYRPQSRALALISTGDQFAVASYGSFALSGKWIWRWKDRIDRRFMAQYNALRATAP